MPNVERPRRHRGRVRILNGFTTEEAEDILGRAETVRFPKDATIFREGTPGNYLFIVIDGVINIFVKDKMIARCKEGEAVGEMSALSDRPRSATTVAATDVELLSLNEDEIRKLLEGPYAARFLLNIICELSKRLDSGNTWVAASFEAQRSRRR